MPIRFRSLPRALSLAGLAVSLAVGFTPAAHAQESASVAQTQDTLPTDKKAAFGHSMLGDAFNDVPRQRAYLMKGMPNVNFPITAKNSDAQKFFNQGIGQMHGYWYLEAARSFRKVVELDPAGPMGYWGLALAYIENESKSKEFIAKATERESKAGERERLWIRSLADYINADHKANEWAKTRKLALITAWQNIVSRYPDDIEAKAFLAHEYLNDQYLDPKRTKEQIDALMKQVLAANPQHPIHHYRIHLWDQENTEKNALLSAAQSGVSGPGIAHLWHMQGHTYTGLKRYADAAYSQEASARVDHAYMMRDHILPDEIHNYAHNNQWLVENLEYLGRVHDALDLATNMIELPRHPRFNTLSNGSAAQGRNRLIETLFCYDLWNDALQLDKQGVIEPTDVPNKQMERLTLLADAYFATNDLTNGRKYLSDLLAMQAAHEPKKDKDGKPVKTEEENTSVYDAKLLTSRLAEVHAYEAIAVGNLGEANRQLDLAVKLPPARAARLRLQSGQTAKAEELAKQAVKQNPSQVAPLATLVTVLAQNGKHDEAQKQFGTLRTLAVHADTDTPLLASFDGLAREAGCTASDWRIATPSPADIGPRPNPDTLGPFRWSPMPAPTFTLPDATGGKISLADYTRQGKPVVVIFYLGTACVKCREQLNAFAPLKNEFAQAGIILLAISTDAPDFLKQAYVSQKLKEQYPFPLLADKSAKTFKAFRVYDDFEAMPLHGAFLIDGKGLVRWQDIRFEPFMEARFLLDESKRLLKLGNGGNASSSSSPAF